MEKKIEMFCQWASLYRKTLLEDVVPFWMKYALDPETGSINNCMDDSGILLSRDKNPRNN